MKEEHEQLSLGLSSFAITLFEKVVVTPQCLGFISHASALLPYLKQTFLQYWFRSSRAAHRRMKVLSYTAHPPGQRRM